MKYVYSVILISASLNGVEYGPEKEGVVAQLKNKLGSSFKGLSAEDLPKWKKKIDAKKMQKIATFEPYYIIYVHIPKKKKINKKMIVYEDATKYNSNQFDVLVNGLVKDYSTWKISFVVSRLADDEK